MLQVQYWKFNFFGHFIIAKNLRYDCYHDIFLRCYQADNISLDGRSNPSGAVINLFLFGLVISEEKTTFIRIP